MSFLRRKGQMRGSEFSGAAARATRFVPPWHDARRARLQGRPITDRRKLWAPRSILSKCRRGKGCPLYPTISRWPAWLCGCTQQSAAQKRKNNPAGPSDGIHPQRIEHSGSGWVASAAAITATTPIPLPFSVEKTPGNYSNRANPKKSHPRMIPPLRA